MDATPLIIGCSIAPEGASQISRMQRIRVHRSSQGYSLGQKSAGQLSMQGAAQLGRVQLGSVGSSIAQRVQRSSVGVQRSSVGMQHCLVECRVAQAGQHSSLGYSVDQKGAAQLSGECSLAQQGAAQLSWIQRSSEGCRLAQGSAAQLSRVQRSSVGYSVKLCKTCTLYSNYYCMENVCCGLLKIHLSLFFPSPSRREFIIQKYTVILLWERLQGLMSLTAVDIHSQVHCFCFRFFYIL